jgi:hypothetical protein
MYDSYFPSNAKICKENPEEILDFTTRRFISVNKCNYLKVDRHNFKVLQRHHMLPFFTKFLGIRMICLHQAMVL